MLNVAMIKEYFVIKHDVLYYLRADGTARPLTDVLNGTLICKIGGKIFKGPEVAWALLHGTAPMFPVILLSPDPTDMSVENLAPVRGTRLRFRPIEVARGWRHCLNSSLYFATRESCHADWLVFARRHYAVDISWVLQQERARDRLMEHPGFTRPHKFPTHTGRKAEAKPSCPQFIPGRMWYWYDDQWVSVPPACHPADDYKERCRHVLAGATSFQFNAVTEMVEPIYPIV
jgi:hypothetical protein